MTKCKWCGEEFLEGAGVCPACKREQSPLASVPAEAVARWISLSQVVGILVIIAGLAIGVYFAGFFDSTVSTPQGRLNSPALVVDRQNGLIVSLGVTIIGVVLALKKV